MTKSKSTENGQTILPNRGHSEQGFADSNQETSPPLDSKMGKSKVFSIKDLEGILARPGQKPISLADMEEAIAFGAVKSGLGEES